MKILFVQNNLIKVIRYTLFLGVASLAILFLNWDSIIANENNLPSNTKVAIFFSLYSLVIIFGFIYSLKSPTQINLEGRKLTIYRWILGTQIFELEKPLETKVSWTLSQNVTFAITVNDKILAKINTSNLILVDGDLPNLNFNQYTPNSEPFRLSLRLKMQIDRIIGNEFKSEFC